MGEGARAPRNWAVQLTLFKPGEQIMPNKLLPALGIHKAIYTSVIRPTKIIKELLKDSKF